MTCPYFVNLPARYMTGNGGYLDYFIDNAINPEVGLDLCWDDDFTVNSHKVLAGRIKDAGLSCTVHLPFTDLQAGSLDNLIRQATTERIRRAFEAASVYEPLVMNAHAGLNVMMYSGEFYSRWLDRSASTWAACLAEWPEHPPLAFENTHEPGPDPVLDLIGMVLAKGAPGVVGMCLDIGHWHSFGNGSVMNNLWNWLVDISDRVRLLHMHLHDNDGSGDQHLGLGAGSIPFDELFAGLERLNLRPSLTLEPHSEGDLSISRTFVAAHPEWFPARN